MYKNATGRGNGQNMQKENNNTEIDNFNIMEEIKVQNHLKVTA